MTIYRYHSSLIDEVRIIANASGGYRACLHARMDATPEQLGDVQKRLLQNGYKTIPCVENGRPQLEVRGFKKPDDLLNYLAGHALVQGAPETIQQKEDIISPKERLRNATLKGTGLVYNLGDFCYLIYATKGFQHDTKLLKEAIQTGASEAKIASAKGAVSGAKLDIGGGIGYAIGGSVLSFFASKDQSQNEIQTGVRNVRRFIMKEGITIPQDSSAHEIAKKEDRPPLQKLTHFVKKHPSEILNTVYTGVGILLAAASIKKVRAGWIKGESFMSPLHAGVRDDVKDIGLGAVTMTSALTGLLVKEKKRDPDEPKHGGIRGVWQWIEEKPLRATGVGYFISTMFHAWSTYGKYQKGDELVRDTVKFRAGFVAANILAEALLFLSSKGHGQGVKTDESVEKSIIAATAEIISQQNPALQQRLVDQLAGYMASPDVLGGKAEAIAGELRAQLAGFQSNPWAVHAQGTAAAPASPAVKADIGTDTPSRTPHTVIDAPSIAASERATLAHAPAVQALGA